MSMTRFDFGLGDNVNFNQVLFDQVSLLLLYRYNSSDP